MKRILACASFLVIAACGDDTYNYQFPEEDIPQTPVVQKPSPTPVVTPVPVTEVAPPPAPPEPAPECVSPRRCKDHDEDKPKCC